VTGYRHGTTEAGVITWDGYDLGDGMLAGDPPDGFTWGACPIVLPPDDPCVKTLCYIDDSLAGTQHFERRQTEVFDPSTGVRTVNVLGDFLDDAPYTPTGEVLPCSEHGDAAAQTTYKRKTLVGPATWPAPGDITAMLSGFKFSAIIDGATIDDGHGNTSLLFRGESEIGQIDCSLPFLTLPTLDVPAGATVTVSWSEISP